ncbi:MAG: WYL domain-containing protein, partial [Chloroflexota bacterium]
MSVMIVTALILARAEAGELPVSARFAATPDKPDVKIVTVATLKSLKEELVKWKLGRSLYTLVDLLFKAGLLVRDDLNYLRPTPAAYTMLQLPPASSHRLLLESSGELSLPLPHHLVSRLTGNGLPRNNTEYQALVEVLQLFDFVRLDPAGVYLAETAAVKLLRALVTFSPKPTTPDAPAQLLLAAEWQACYPGHVTPDKGWLTWDQSLFAYSFRKPILGEPLTFDTWQLFRLLVLCDVVTSNQPEVTEQYRAKPILKRLAEASLRGLSFKSLQSRLTDGLDLALPAETTAELNRWLQVINRYQARELVVLEASDRPAMEELLTDSRLRSYVSQVISPRHVTVRKADLKRLQQLMARRQQFLQLDPSLQVLGTHSQAVPMSLTRAQVQELVSAVLCYRRQQVELGYPTLEIDSLLSTLQTTLTLREQDEANRRASELGPLVSTDRPIAEPAPDEESNLLQKIKEAIWQETEILIEYTVPGRPSQQRWIEPLVLRDEGESTYLTAYCKLRKEERVFRLGRLRLL